VILAKNEGGLTTPPEVFVPVNVTVTAYLFPCACGDPAKVNKEDGPPDGTPDDGD
jgi:hypothetical protein